jgi:hypothetical protein
MVPKRPQAPSRARYATANPPRSVRLKPKPHAKIVAIRERQGVSFNQAVNIAVDGLDDAAMEVIHAHGYEQGFRAGVNHDRAERAAAYANSDAKFLLTLPCPKCGQPIESRSPRREFLVAVLHARPLVHQIGPSPLIAPSAPDG